MALRNTGRELRLPMPVRDAATRMFHWLLAASVVAACATAWLGMMAPHRACGVMILVLLLFRVLWGFVGSDTARFVHVLDSPLVALKQFYELPRRAPDNQVGPTVGCGWMTVFFLGVLAALVSSGLVANAAVHALASRLLLGAIALHLLAILAYPVIGRRDLVRPMITGRKRLPAATPAPRMANPVLALAVLIVAGAAAGAIMLLL
jgi:cytochrome b